MNSGSFNNANEDNALPIDAKGMANLILDWAEGDGVPITPMKLQKILYFCHADYLVQFSKKLIKQEFEAWDYGPVIPSIYAEFKSSRGQPIADRAFIFDPISARRKIAFCCLSNGDGTKLRALYSFYRHFGAEELSRISHEAGGPWRQARSLFANGLNMDRRINDGMIERYHRPPHD